MEKRVYKKLANGFKKFMAKEPIYLWLLVFIIVINVLTFIPAPDSGKKEAALGNKKASADLFLENRVEIEKSIAKDTKVATAVAFIIMGIVISIFVGILLDFWILAAKSGARGLLKRSLAPQKVKWSVWDALKVIILFFFFGYVLAIIGALLIPILPPGNDTERIVSIITNTLMDLVGLLVVFYFAFFSYKQNARDLGLTRRNFFRNVSYGFLGYLSALPSLFVTLIATSLFIELVRYKPAPQPVFNLFMEEKNAPILVYLSVFVAVAGPVMEEIFFRGFVYTAMRKEIGVGSAIAASAFLFSLLHVHPVGFLPILILGLLLAYLYEKTGSLVPSITVHVLHNLAMVAFIFLAKGIHG